MKKSERQLKIERKNEKRRHKRMIKVIAQCNCGCCTEEMYFRDFAAAKAAFEKVGLSNSATIVDDEGTEHTGIDTFYGLTENPKEMERPSLLRLMEKL